jgi:hypothetical protein
MSLTNSRHLRVLTLRLQHDVRKKIFFRCFSEFTVDLLIERFKKFCKSTGNQYRYRYQIF